MNWLRDFGADEGGATATEYAVMLALILVACVLAIGHLGQKNADNWGQNNGKLAEAFNGGS